MGNTLIIPKPVTLENYKDFLRQVQDKGFLIDDYENIIDYDEIKKIYDDIKAKLNILCCSDKMLSPRDYDLRTY